MMPLSSSQMRRQLISKAFAVLCGLATVLCVSVLVGLLWSVISLGIGGLSWSFLTSFPSWRPGETGILPALVSSLWLIALTALFSVPVGVGAAIYLEEYAAVTRWRKLIQLNIANLAGVPSIVYGILGLGLFVRGFGLGTSILAGSLTLTLVVLPVVILASQEALRAVPNTIRHASYALGATRWQTVWHQILPAAMPGILTGIILSISRALGEAAPLVAVGAAAYMTFVPISPGDDFSAMPLQIFYWAGHPREEFHRLAASAIIVLLTVLILMNITAIYLRYRYSRRFRW